MIIPLKFYKNHSHIKGLWIILKLSVYQVIKLPLYLFMMHKKREVLNFELTYPRLKEDEKGNNVCLSCELCVKICPTQAIKIDFDKKKPVDIKNKLGPRPKEFEISSEKCVQCGLCIAACPVNALTKDFSKGL